MFRISCQSPAPALCAAVLIGLSSLSRIDSNSTRTVEVGVGQSIQGAIDGAGSVPRCVSVRTHQRTCSSPRTASHSRAQERG
jgi:hypothetical protein